MPRRSKGFQSRSVFNVLGAVLVCAVSLTVQAATLCVNPTGSSGCQATIGKAVSAASPGDTIQVAAGTYKEDVTIGKALSLIGAGSALTIIDATGLGNGIVVDGVDNPGLSNVVITGFTVENANFEGILVENSSNVTIWQNQILKNNVSLNVSESSCPGLPAAFQAGEAFDCGEGLHFSGVDHSVAVDNVIQNNAGGILLSDDTGATFDNVITRNAVSNNPFDCGITLASHSGMGVYSNTIADNLSMNNGNKVPGAGAGVGLFAPGPGSQTYGNVIINNQLIGNGLPGVAMHNHAAPPGAPAVKLSDNIIVGNVISANGADTDDAATPGTAGINLFSLAPVTGTVIVGNTISQEHLAVVFNAPSGQVSASLNNLLSPIGVDNAGTGIVNAPENWWGCTQGPNVGGCSLTLGSGISYTPVLASAFNLAQLPAAPGSVTPPPTTSGVTIVVTGPGGATSPTNTFQVFLNQVTVNASGSTSTNPGPLSYSWSVSPGFPTGGGIVGATTATPTFQLTTPQTYQYTLTVTDSTGAKATTTVTVQYI